jgi:PadR family transcriptional regulator, regulatory protein AphA
MAGTRLTDFEQILIGMIAAQPASGYDLKREFATTPASVYQPSSGAIYPALRRLEQHGLLRQAPQEFDQRIATRRQRNVYRVTPEGRAVHAAWIREPVNPATVSQDLGMHLMRFVMMEPQLPRAEVLAFLSSLQSALRDFVAGIERFAAALDATGLHGPLALDHGIAVHRASLDWTGRAIAALSASERPLGARKPRFSRHPV